MTVFIEIGEFITLQSCLVLVFIILATLFSLKFGIIFKIAKPVIGFLAGVSVGAYLLSFFADDTFMRVGSILAGIIGLVLSLFLTNTSSKV